MAKDNQNNQKDGKGKKGAKGLANRTYMGAKKARPGMKKSTKKAEKRDSQKGTRKYRFMPHDSIEVVQRDGKKVRLYRIEALRTFGKGKGKVKKGTKGGYVGLENLSQKGNCWVGFGCMAFEGSEVKGGAVLEKGAKARDKSIVMGGVRITGPITVRGKARVSGQLTLISKLPEHVFTEMTGIGTFLFTRDGLKQIR